MTASDQTSEDDVGLTTSALTVCNEMVPANRNVDGIPSYAQCGESMNSAIFSNNGVDTSTTQMGSDWVRTQWSGGYQCTELAHRYLHFKWGVKWIPNGNAGQWCDTQPPASVGVVQTMEPVHGDIMVLAPGSCGAAQGTGHVTVVDVVNGDKLTVVEQNGARRGNYMKSCGKCYLHVMANDGNGAPAAGAAGAKAPATTMQQAAGAGAMMPAPSGAPQRPNTSVPGAGPAAPNRAPASRAASSAAMAERLPSALPPPSKPALQPSAATSTSSTLAAGSAAPAPFASTTTAAPGGRIAAPVQSACSVASVGGGRTTGLGFTLGLMLLAGVVPRLRRRR
jgi:surface antigen